MSIRKVGFRNCTWALKPHKWRMALVVGMVKQKGVCFMTLGKSDILSVGSDAGREGVGKMGGRA